MEPMDWLENHELLRFFRRHKTEMSCMENPQTFLCQLRDHDLIPEDRYKKVSHMRSKDNMRKGLYEILDRFETERSQEIRDFWRCVFKDSILNQYPTLRLLRNSLMDGSFHFEISEKTGKEESDKGKPKALSDSGDEEEEEEGEEKQEKSVAKKRKLRSRSARSEDNEEELAGPSSQLTPRKKSKKICFSTPLKKGEEKNIWNWPIYKLQLPVTCGNREGTLNRPRLAKGERCIVVGKQWFSPTEFEVFAGKKSSKNWKSSIRCMETPLGKLIKQGHLQAVTYKGGPKKVKKSLFPPGDATLVSSGDEDEEEDRVSPSSRESSPPLSDEEREQQAELQPQASHDGGGETVFRVTCGASNGTLHKKRFASGTCGKSIRTEASWMTPVEFLQLELGRKDASWKKDIDCEGRPLCVLVKAEALRIHSLLCNCSLCKPDEEEQRNQKNDDECCICRMKGELVMCDTCPRAFHPTCHLPHVGDGLLGDDNPWFCTFCVYRTNERYFYSERMEREAALSYQISQRMLQCQYLLLCLWSADEEQIFATNPCLYLTDYSDVIEAPMWFGHIAGKLQQRLYQTVGEFVTDVQLVFSNCALYNRINAELLVTGNRLKESFDREFNSVFNIKE